MSDQSGDGRLPPFDPLGPARRQGPSGGPAQAPGEEPRIYLARAPGGPEQGAPSVMRLGLRGVRWFFSSSGGFAGCLRPATTNGYASVEPDGTFRMEQVRVGKGRLSIMWSLGPGGYVTQEVAAVTIVEGQPARVEVTVPTGGTLSGLVRRPADVRPGRRSGITLLNRETERMWFCRGA